MTKRSSCAMRFLGSCIEGAKLVARLAYAVTSGGRGEGQSLAVLSLGAGSRGHAPLGAHWSQKLKRELSRFGPCILLMR